MLMLIMGRSTPEHVMLPTPSVFDPVKQKEAGREQSESALLSSDAARTGMITMIEFSGKPVIKNQGWVKPNRQSKKGH